MASHKNLKGTRRRWSVLLGVFVLFALGATAPAMGMTNESGSSTPWIASDLPDYPPGGSVTLTGGNWQPGESVHISVNDDGGQSWSRDVDRTADGNGNITDSFNLPDWFVATYTVKATGASGAVATANFTDADSTTTTLQSSPNPSFLNQSVTFTAKVVRTALNTAVTVGNIKFGTGGNCTGGFTQLQAGQTPNASGEVTYTTSALATGNTTIRACYSGTGGSSGTQDSSATLTQTVNPKQNQTITFTAPSGKTYGNADFDLGATASSGLPVTYTSSTTSVCTIVSGNLRIVAAGSCTVAANQAGNSAYDAAPQVERTFSIAKANATVVVTWNDSTYDGSPNAASAVANGVAGQTGLTPAPTLAYYAGSTATGTPLAGAPTNAGTYTVRASFAGNDNYNPDSATKTITIAKAATTTTVSCGAGPFTYNGSPHTPCTANVTGPGLTQAVTVSYSNNTNAGTATASGSYAGSDNYLASTDSKTFTIAKAVTTTTVSCGAGPFTYNGSPHTPCTANVTGPGLNQAVTVSYSNNTNAGTATASGSYAGSDNYLASTDSKTFTIAKAATTTTVSCGAGPFTYNGSPHTPCTANVTGPGLTQAVTVSYSNNTNAGTATASGSYAGSDNYLASTDSKTFTIAKANATVVVTWNDSTYDGSPNAASAVANGVAGQTGLTPAPTLAYYAGSTATGTPLAGAPTNAGTYTVRASFAGNDNYNPDSATKTITIAKAVTTTTVSCGAGPFTYNGSPHTPCTANVTGPGLTQAVTVSYSNNTNAGTATASGSYAGSDNYLASTDSKTFTIAKANATVVVTWNDSTYDGSPNAASAVANGVAGQTGLTPAPTLAYYAGSTATGTPLAGAPTNAGTYTVRASFAGNDNYNPDSATKTITIAKANSTVSVSWADTTYDGSPHPATGSVSGVGSPAANLGTPSFTYYAGSTATGTPLAGAPTNAGTYTVRASFAGNDNYNPDSATKTITIAPKPASVTPDAKSKILGAVDPPLTGTLSGFLPADGVTATYSRTAGETVAGNPYTISATLAPVAVLGNYNITYNTANFTILFAWGGFLQPINDTAHQTGVNQSKFRLGQTIPAKFVLTDANGVVVQQTPNPTFTRSGNLGTCDTATTAEILEPVPADSDPVYKWDGNQYHYNWSTKGLTAGEYRIYANLADGTKRYVDICLTK